MNHRRELLRGIGALGAAGVSGWIAQALAAGDLGATQGVNRLDGSAMVNGREAKVGTPVNPGDRVSTGRNSQAVILVKGDAFLMRSQTTFELKKSERDGILSEVVVATGKVLSVFAKKPIAIKAASATIGIRGTGCYLEVDAAEVYFCLCYGEAEVQGPGMAQPREVKTKHHEQPLLLVEANGVLKPEPGPFRNHTDAELIMLEALCGREPPFMKDGEYPSKKY